MPSVAGGIQYRCDFRTEQDKMPITRREFLAGSTAVVAAAPLVAMEPIRRSGKQVLKLSLAGYSMRQHLSGSTDRQGAIDLNGFVDYCGSLGLDGAEPTSYYFPKPVTADFLNQLKRRAHVLGLDISGGAITNNYTLPPGPDLDKHIRHTETWIDHYAQLGAPVIRVFAGPPPKDTPKKVAIDRCITVLEQVCETAGRRGIMLALENNNFTRDVDILLEIVKGVQSPWFGVNFDSGNLDGLDPYAEMVKMAPYAVNAQIKEAVHPINRPAQPADLNRVVSILRDAGYSGYLVLEYEGKPDPYEGVPFYIEKLRRAIG